ncbi:MAG: hypothetical protein ACLS7Z_03695 [Christensenellales bacterium]
MTRPSEYDLLNRPDGGALLMEMCARTGGTVFLVGGCAGGGTAAGGAAD